MVKGHRDRWENNIKVYDVYWIHVAQDRDYW
jgi:hypothetical protein